MGGLGIGCAGALLGNRPTSAIAALLLALGCLAFLINMGLVFSHWIFPQIEPLAQTPHSQT
jgi:hypothetical protein